MKVKAVESTRGKLVIFWCAGCGLFHEAPREKWNENVDEPSIGGEIHYPNEDKPTCISSVYRGVVSWDVLSKHRLAGKALPMQHEETWKSGAWSEVKP